MRTGVRYLLLSQIVLAVAAVLLMLSLRPTAGHPGLAAAYGGAMALINTLLLAWRTRRAGAAAAAGGDDPMPLLGMMGGIIERLVFTLAAFAVGMAVLRLDPVALIVGFACAELGYAGAAWRSLRR